jgi:lipopolysaccharide biosynthesis glycosyltransferase
MALVFAGDEGVALPLAVAMHSALVNLSPGTSPDIYVLDCGLTEPTRERLLNVTHRARPAPLHWVPVSSDRLSQVMAGGSIAAASFSRLSAATYARLLLSELIPERVRRVVFLDADILVRGDLRRLLTLDLEGAPVGAVCDYIEDTTFNAGVLVLDMERWRSDELGERALRYAVENRVIDQHGLNAVVPDWHKLPYEWNVQNGNLFFEGLHGLAPPRSGGAVSHELQARRWQLVRKAAVLHFVGGVKPWNRLCPLPGTTRWVWAMVRTRWYPPGPTLAWLVRYVLSRTRYWLGSVRLMVMSRVRAG